MHKAIEILIGSMLLALAAQAETIRQLNPIPVPDPQLREAIKQGQRLRSNAVAGLKQLSREQVEAAVRRIYAAYNTPDFRQYLSERFYDPERLLSAIDEKVPREATLRLISVNSVQTVSSQRVRNEQNQEVEERLVIVIVRAQIEFTNALGFQRREGESELVLRFQE